MQRPCQRGDSMPLRRFVFATRCARAARICARSGTTGARRGVYLWGGVGRGKTFVMDLFQGHAGAPVRREHFHRFMKEVHARLHELRDVTEPLVRVASEMRG